MENKEIRNDDFLGDLIRQIPADAPSDDFVNRIMMAIQPEVVLATEKKPLFSDLKSALPYAALVLFCMLIFATSDIPFFNNLAGNGFFRNHVVPYMVSILHGIAASFDTKYVSWGLLVGFGGGFIFLVDRYFSRRTTA